MDEFQEIAVVGLDLDQTLYPKSELIDQSYRAFLSGKLAAHLGCDFEEALEKYDTNYDFGRGLSGRKTLEKFGITNADDLIQEASEQDEIAELLIPDQKTIEVVNWLKNGYSNLDLLTGSRHIVAIKKLGSLSIKPLLFTHIIGGDQASKSTGEAYKLWMHYYPDLRPANFLYIGDRVMSDHIVPSALGIKTILVYVDVSDPELNCPQLPSFAAVRDFLVLS